MAGQRKKLSKRQQCILDYIAQHYDTEGIAPSIREIGSACEISSTSVVEYNLQRLEEMGYIERTNNVARGIVLKQWSDRHRLSVPIYGTIAAGQPIPLPEEANIEDFVPIWREFLPSAPDEDFFALRVKGDSMIDALVDDGDVVICLREESPDNVNRGEMVAAWLRDENEATLKHFYFQEPASDVTQPSNDGDGFIQVDPDDLPAHGQVRLEPANPAYNPIVVPADQVELHGRVVLVIRQY